MERSDTDELILQMPPVAEDNSRINRVIRRLPCVTSRLVTVLSIFCFGLVSGAGGGLLLGGTAVVVLQSLELLSDNRVLMDQLEKYLMVDYCWEKRAKKSLKLEDNIQVHDIQISIFAMLFSMISSALSLVAGICIGLSMYSLVIKRRGEAAMGKALSIAGSVGLVSVTAIGYILGHTLESFLSMTLNVNIYLWIFVSVLLLLLLLFSMDKFKSSYILVPVGFCFLASFAALITFLLSFLSKMRLILAGILTPTILALDEFGKSHSIKLTTLTVPLLLTIYDLYNIAGQQIVALQSPASTNTSSLVPEAIFVGLLASLLWTVTVGMSLFASWQMGGAGKICITAAGSGAAVLGGIKLALPVLGPGPTVGALVGVAGAAGVSVSAAVAVTEQYGREVDHYGLVGSVGVTVGAAVGAFLSSCAHSGLSGIFMALCAATVPAGAFLKVPFLRSTSQLLVCLWICLYLVLIPFIGTAVLQLLLLDKYDRDRIRPLFHYEKGAYVPC